MKPAYSNHPMAININLIPRQETQRNIPALPIALLTVALGASLALGWLWYDSHSRLADAKLALEQANESASKLQESMTARPASGSIKATLAQPKSLREAVPPTTQVMAELTELLPLYANITQLEMSSDGHYKLSARFSTTEAIITFRQSVAKSDHFAIVNMAAINNMETTPEAAQDASAVQPGSLPIYQTSFDLQYTNLDKGGQ
ncbi:hypothetical protein [Cohnella yongneupensis]|uniref:Fimbrial assembly protein n=1 Tax=Cohnella yongneupensis TaxID=425006 RepID=A0ABW0R5U5_9BACL